MTIEEGGHSEVSILYGSSWLGNLSINEGYGNVELINSKWNGDVNMTGDLSGGSSADFELNMENSSREGNAIIREGNFSSQLNDDSSLKGDVMVTDGYAYMYATDYSVWDGDYKGESTNNYTAGNVVLFGNSLWQGNLVIDHGKMSRQLPYMLDWLSLHSGLEMLQYQVI